MEVTAELQQEDLAPEFKLTHHVVPKRYVHLGNKENSCVMTELEGSLLVAQSNE